jgi:preprotein translocase subunit SecE
VNAAASTPYGVLAGQTERKKRPIKNMADSNPVEFLREVRDEARKVTWPTRRELAISTIMVLIMVVVASIFFLGVDAMLKVVVDKVMFGL